ncbi:hypothetical protein [Micromonospora echinospora]|uniref:hypothetical protein n=1 Tax=Micromonospora echinospora TaxID=1877 RepID=UPI003A8858DB
MAIEGGPEEHGIDVQGTKDRHSPDGSETRANPKAGRRSLYLTHRLRFPSLAPPSSATLGDGPRSITVDYSYALDPDDEGPLGRELQEAAGTRSTAVAASWTTELRRSLGSVAASTDFHALRNRVRLIYLPATRNPVDDLARREARVLVELLRAQQQRLTGRRDLTNLRAKAARLLDALASTDLIQAVEQRIGEHLGPLTAGVRQHWPFVRGQAVSDEYLARVLELMVAAVEDRLQARNLAITGLGYVNLLHIAVTLAAIPDPTHADDAKEPDAVVSGPEGTVGTTSTEANGPDDEEQQVMVAAARLAQARVERNAEEDSFFSSAPFHATVVIEEPEAHLHPQLQHGLARYLRESVRNRRPRRNRRLRRETRTLPSRPRLRSGPRSGHRMDSPDTSRTNPSRSPPTDASNDRTAPHEPNRDHQPGPRPGRHHHRAPRRRPRRQGQGLPTTRPPPRLPSGNTNGPR